MKLSVFIKKKLKWERWEKDLTLRESLANSGMKKVHQGKLNLVSKNTWENAFQIPAQKIQPKKIYVIAHDNELDEKGYVLGVSHSRGNLVLEAFSIDADDFSSKVEDLKDICEISLKKSEGKLLFPAELFYFSSSGRGYRCQPLVFYVSENMKYYVRKSQLKDIIKTMKSIIKGMKRQLSIRNNQMKKYASLIKK